ncbi:MAG: extensin family protein [Devosia sp.]
MALISIALCGPALAQGAGDIPLPRERPEAVATDTTPLPRPDPRKSQAVETAPVPAPADAKPGEAAPADVAPKSIVVEPAAPPRDFQVACPAVMNGEVTAKPLPPIHEGQCGLQSPLSLEAVMANGRSIPINAPVTTDCGMATALPGWVADIDSYLKAHDKTQIESLIIGTNYACRNVNNEKSGNLSFHAFGDALDVSGFKLDDGRTITVEPAWNGTEAEGSKIIRFAHDAACTHFTTVLGPEANALHHDHLHVDLGCHGKTCTARLCE